MEHTKFKRTKRNKIPAISFDVPVNGRSYSVTASPFTIGSGELMYRVSYNNGPVHIFGWDSGLNRFAETDEQADIIPPIIEIAIANKLNEQVAEGHRHAA